MTNGNYVIFWPTCCHKCLLWIGRKEGSVLFNDALNTFYLQLYGSRHMVKDHSDSEIGIPLPPHGLLFSINSKGVLLYAPSHRQDSTYHGLCYTSRGALAGTRNSSMVHPMKDRSDDPSHHERTLLPRSYILLHYEQHQESYMNLVLSPRKCVVFVVNKSTQYFNNVTCFRSFRWLADFRVTFMLYGVWFMNFFIYYLTFEQYSLTSRTVNCINV